VSAVLNRKRPLSLRMVKRLHDGLKIPYQSLLAKLS
jgi:HTH-type transcriptional regulator/antitoxin HigA